jgi:hypothetical protein
LQAADRGHHLIVLGLLASAALAPQILLALLRLPQRGLLARARFGKLLLGQRFGRLEALKLLGSSSGSGNGSVAGAGFGGGVLSGSVGRSASGFGSAANSIVTGLSAGTSAASSGVRAGRSLGMVSLNR